MGEDWSPDESDYRLKNSSRQSRRDADTNRSLAKVTPIGADRLKINEEVVERGRYGLDGVPVDQIRAVVRGDGSVRDVINLQQHLQIEIEQLLGKTIDPNYQRLIRPKRVIDNPQQIEVSGEVICLGEQGLEGVPIEYIRAVVKNDYLKIVGVIDIRNCTQDKIDKLLGITTPVNSADTNHKGARKGNGKKKQRDRFRSFSTTH